MLILYTQKCCLENWFLNFKNVIDTNCWRLVLLYSLHAVLLFVLLIEPHNIVYMRVGIVTKLKIEKRKMFLCIIMVNKARINNYRWRITGDSRNGEISIFVRKNYYLTTSTINVDFCMESNHDEDIKVRVCYNL